MDQNAKQKERAGTFSRVSTVSLLVVGCALIVLWRVLLSNLIVRALEEWAFAERKIVLIAEKGQLGTSRALVELSRSGYRPTRIFEINRSETDALGVPSSLRATLDEVIELSRRAPIEQLFLLNQMGPCPAGRRRPEHSARAAVADPSAAR